MQWHIINTWNQKKNKNMTIYSLEAQPNGKRNSNALTKHAIKIC